MTSPAAIPSPRTAVLRRLFWPNSKNFTKNEIDRVLCVYFPKPNSFTGEDVVELHVHGSPAVVKETLESLGTLHFAPAKPGLFVGFFRHLIFVGII